jgi:uncharacterized cupredoxin-like copper-binding protein
VAPSYSPRDSQVGVTLKEYSIQVQPEQAPPGHISFKVENQGTITHEFDVYQSSLRLDGLPINKSTLQVDENSPQVHSVVLSISIVAGNSTAVDASMPPGRYYFICNQPSHYNRGMRLAYTVR